MKKGILKFIWILIICALQTSNIFAQCFIDLGYKWPVNSVTFHINNSLATPLATQQEYETAVKNAATTWNDVGTSF